MEGYNNSIKLSHMIIIKEGARGPVPKNLAGRQGRQGQCRDFLLRTGTNKVFLGFSIQIVLCRSLWSPGTFWAFVMVAYIFYWVCWGVFVYIRRCLPPPPPSFFLFFPIQAEILPLVSLYLKAIQIIFLFFPGSKLSYYILFPLLKRIFFLNPRGTIQK